jgi:hypothetical protein
VTIFTLGTDIELKGGPAYIAYSLLRFVPIGSLSLLIHLPGLLTQHSPFSPSAEGHEVNEGFVGPLGDAVNNSMHAQEASLMVNVFPPSCLHAFICMYVDIDILCGLSTVRPALQVSFAFPAWQCSAQDGVESTQSTG